MKPDFDPSKPLKDAQHERFAHALAKGESQRQAYADAGYEPHDGNASRLSNNEKVSQRVQWLKEQAASDLVLSIAEKRQFIARVVRSAPIAANMDNPDCELVMTKMGPIAKLPDKAALIRIDNDLAGDGSEANKVPVVLVKIGGFDDADD